jgi:hypothetical protein
MKTRLRYLALVAAIPVALFLDPPAEAHSPFYHLRPSVSITIGGGYWHPSPAWGPPVAAIPAGLPDTALVDTDISPEEAEVWLDGERIGTADDFDGFPSYLEVPAGWHRLEFRYPGSRTLRIDLRARPGGYYDFNRELRPAGASREGN